MVVLEGANIIIPMLTIGNNQYLQPDYSGSVVRLFFPTLTFVTILKKLLTAKD